MDKRSVKKVVLPMCLLAFLFAGSGCCNFYQLEGNGSRPKAEWAEYLPKADGQKMDEIRVDAATSDVTILFDRGDYGGYKVKLHSEFKWGFPVGPYHERSFWLPDSKRGGRSLCMELDGWGTELLPYMVGLFTGGSSKVYDFPRGDCIAYQRFMRAGIIPLLAYESSVLPVITDGTLTPGGPNAMSPSSLCEISTSLEGIRLDQMGEYYFWPATSLNRQKYNRLTSYYFLCGLLAFGQKNERAYLQIAWFPIELWSLEEEPPLQRVMSRFN
jgi:hypothetical protein